MMDCPLCKSRWYIDRIRISSGGVRCLCCGKFVSIAEGSPEASAVMEFVREHQRVVKTRQRQTIGSKTEHGSRE